MAIQVRSSARSAERRRTAGVRIVIWVCVWLCLLVQGPATQSQTQVQPSEITDQFRFKVTDSENDLPIPGATVALLYWRRKDFAEEKKEIELKNGQKRDCRISKSDG